MNRELDEKAVELLPCPFCGEYPVASDRTIWCSNRDCWGPNVENYANMEDAIAAWNRRATSPSIGRVVEWPGDNYELYEDAHNKAIAEYEAATPAYYRYSATALRRAVDVAVRAILSTLLPSPDPAEARAAVLEEAAVLVESRAAAQSEFQKSAYSRGDDIGGHGHWKAQGELLSVAAAIRDLTPAQKEEAVPVVWQPIETAPKDGKPLVIWVEDGKIAPHAFSPVSITEDGAWWDDSTGDQIEPIVGATYWLRVTPPQEGK